MSYVHTCIEMHVHAHVSHVYLCVWRPDVNFRCLPQSSCFPPFQDCESVWVGRVSELTHSAELIGYQVPRIFPSLPPQDPRHVPSWCLAFYISSGDSNSGPYVCTANTYQLSPLCTKFSLSAAQSTVMGDLKG